MIDREAQSIRAGFERNRKKYIAAAGTAAVIAASAVFCGRFYTGWLGIPGTGCLYFIEEGDLKEDTWIRRDDGAWQHTDENAGIQRGLTKIGEDLYLFDKDGVMQTGWSKDGEGIRYFRTDGRAAKGWEDADGGTRYFDGMGIMKTGWLTLGNDTYYLGREGKMRTGWQEITEENGLLKAARMMSGETDRYFFLDDGKMVRGWHKEGDDWYLFSGSGRMLTGDQMTKDGLYMLAGDGKMQTGWHETEDGMRYHEKSGEAVRGWHMIEGDRYFFGDNYLMRTGEVELDGESFYLEEDGTVSEGWHESEDSSFYVCSDGYVLNTDGERGDFGRLVIRKAGISVPVYTEKSRDRYQSVTDKEDSALAVKERRDDEYAVADRRSQGFVLDEVEEGDSAYVIRKDGDVEAYFCDRVCTGTATGKDVLDDEDRSVWKQNGGGFCTYSNAGTEDSEEVLIAFWKKEEAG